MTLSRRVLALHLLTVLAGVVGALGLVSVVRRASLSLAEEPALAGYASQHTADISVHAPTAAAARDGHREVQEARTRFAGIFGGELRPMVVVLVNDPVHIATLALERVRRPGASLLPFVTPEHLAGRTRATSSFAPHRENGLTQARPLAHEACHVFVADVASTFAPASGMNPGAYGHAALPDWVDEAAATLCESPEVQHERHAYLRANLARRIPLHDFVRMQHPLADAAFLDPPGGASSASGYAVEVLDDDETRRKVLATDALLFYAQALSVGQFLSERGGPAALKKLLPQLAAGGTLDDALREAGLAVPGLPASVDELEREWVIWLESEIRPETTGGP